MSKYFDTPSFKLEERFSRVVPFTVRESAYEEGKRISTSVFPYLVRGDNWWLGEVYQNTVIISWGNAKQRLGAKHYDFYSKQEAMDALAARSKKKLEEGWTVSDQISTRYELEEDGDILFL